MHTDKLNLRQKAKGERLRADAWRPGFARSQAPAWECSLGSSSFPTREAGASLTGFPSRSLGTSAVLDQREVLADSFTSLCLGSGIPAGTTVSRKYGCIPESSYRQGCRYPVPWTVTWRLGFFSPFVLPIQSAAESLPGNPTT